MCAGVGFQLLRSLSFRQRAVFEDRGNVSFRYHLASVFLRRADDVFRPPAVRFPRFYPLATPIVLVIVHALGCLTCATLARKRQGNADASAAPGGEWVCR